MSEVVNYSEAMISTRAWSKKFPHANVVFSDSELAPHLFIRVDLVSADRKRRKLTMCTTPELEFLLREERPPIVHIRSAPGEDISEIKALVEAVLRPTAEILHLQGPGGFGGVT